MSGFDSGKLMVETKNDSFVFSFPEVCKTAYLEVYFAPECALQGRLRMDPLPVENAYRLDTRGAIVMRLCPMPISNYYPVYPFALIVSVEGVNALTGERRAALLDRNPQNYVTTPPQGGIDGYFQNGRVHAFHAGNASLPNRARLRIRVLPMKSEAFAYFQQQRRLIPGPGPSALRGITVAHGGERTCEPIYEDICSFGDWDQTRHEDACVWLACQH